MIQILKKINNIKCPKIINKNNFFYIFGMKIVNENIENKIVKFNLFYEKYSLNFDFIEEKNIDFKYDNNYSFFIRDILEYNNEYIFLIENKSIDKHIQTTNHIKCFIKKEDLENFKINKIEKIDLENYLIFKIKYGIIFSSKIEIDEERPDYYWGKYLFNFRDENNYFYNPKFDKIVDYEKDKGHLLHYIEELDINNPNKLYFIIFTIRHKLEDNPTAYYYKIYLSYTHDFKNFFNTREIEIQNNITDSKWYCYPEIFKSNGKFFVLLNQDDFGKEKDTLFGELII